MSTHGEQREDRMAWLGVAAGAFMSFGLSLLLWWYQYRVLVPQLEFGSGISRLTDVHGTAYRIKVFNASRRRGAIDLDFDIALHLGQGLVTYREARLIETLTMVRVYTAVDGILRLRPQVSRVMRLDLRASRWKDVSPRLLALLQVDPNSDEEVSLEGLLSATPSVHLCVRVLAYDEVSGSRKYFVSQRYYLGHIRTGAFNGMSVGRDGGW